jgi:hypothetical protein
MVLSHRTVYRMATALQPLLLKCEDLMRFHEERESRAVLLRGRDDTAKLFERALALAGGHGPGGDPAYNFCIDNADEVALSRSTAFWVQAWHRSLVHCERRILELDATCHQTLLVVRAGSLVQYLLRCPRECLQTFKEPAPPLCTDACLHSRVFLMFESAGVRGGENCGGGVRERAGRDPICLGD